MGDRQKIGLGKKKEQNYQGNEIPEIRIRGKHCLRRTFNSCIGLDVISGLLCRPLVFLGYDSCGKTIEKEVWEKREELRQSGVSGLTAKDEFVLELGRDEQLTKKDIEKALNDSTVVPKPLYKLSNATLQVISYSYWFNQWLLQLTI